MEQLRHTHDQEAATTWFTTESLGLLALQLAEIHYKGYPLPADRLYGEPDSEPVRLALAQTSGRHFARAYKTLELPNLEEQRQFTDQGIDLDPRGRPLHPWHQQMVASKLIGAALGNGFYWKYGPNPTADPIVIRRDLDEPHVLLHVRNDTGQLALAGGFVDQNEEPQIAAYRECKEETGLDLDSVQHTVRKVYDGPLADVRATMHAWPHTHAYAIEVDGSQIQTPLHYEHIDADSNEVNRVRWTPIRNANDEVFGSHRLLINLAN